MNKERLLRRVEAAATEAALGVMKFAESEEARRWCLLRFSQRVQYHLEIMLGAEVEKVDLLAGEPLEEDWTEP